MSTESASGIDVIVPAYRAHATLGRTLDSIAAQTIAGELCVVVVDDACPEGGYRDVVAPFLSRLNIQLLRLPRNLGPGGARQAGIDATGINFAVQTFSAKIPGAFSTALGTFLLSLTSFVLVEADSIADLASSGFTQTREAITEMYLVTTLPGIIASAISYTLLLCFYKLRSKDVAIMAKCNSGEITREEAEKLLSRKY